MRSIWSLVNYYSTGLNNGFGAGTQPNIRLTKIEEDDVGNIGIHAT
jgi:hypothetical protein